MQLTDAAAVRLTGGLRSLRTLWLSEAMRMTLHAPLALSSVHDVAMAHYPAPLLAAWQAVAYGVNVARARNDLPPMDIS